MKLAATSTCFFIELAICLWILTRPLLKLDAVLAAVLAPVAIPELIFRLLQH